MQNTVLIEILNTLNKDELNHFEDFILSPFHNKKTPVIKLFNVIKKYYPGFRDIAIQRENIWGKIFPGKDYNYGVMKNLIYDLTRLSEEFISHFEYDKDVQRKKLRIINFFYRKNNYGLSLKYLDKIKDKTSGLSDSDPDSYLNLYNLEKIRTSILYSKISDKHSVFSGSEFDMTSKYILEGFLVTILENYVKINGLNKIHNSEIKMPMLPEVLNFIKTNQNFTGNIFIKTYYYILLLDLEQNMKYYFDLKNILSETDSETNTQFSYMLWENISNHIAFRYHKGDTEMLKEIFELNKLALEKKIYFAEEGENFFVLNFTTFINVATNLKEIEWAENFVKEYSCKLDETVREDVKNFCLSGISILKQDFTEANEFLSKVKKLHEPHMKANLKLNMLIIYYELGWYESSINVIDSFKHLLKSEKNFQEVIKEKYRKFIRGYSMLIDLKSKNDIKSRMKLEKFLLESDGTASVNWLKRKAKLLGIFFKV